MRTRAFELVGETAIILFLLLTPIHPLMAAAGALVAIDTITGMVAARKRKEQITSAALRRTVSKMVVYQVAIISGFILETYLLSEALPIAKLAAGWVGVTEFKSIVENLSTIQGAPILGDVLKKLGSENDRTKEDPKGD